MSSIFPSPLYRGSLWNTSTPQRLTGVYLIFQSPLHRGSLWNLAEKQLQNGIRLFQSPLHRGSLWNLAWIGVPVRIVLISVPSSSGKSLELLSGSGLVRGLFFSSPLYPGECV